MENKNFIQNPSKKTLIVFSSIFLIGWSLLYYSAIDDNGNFEGFNPIIWFILLSNLFVVGNLYRNYFNAKKLK